VTSNHNRESSYTIIDRVLFGDSWIPWIRLVLACLVFTLLIFTVSGTISWLWPVLTSIGAAGAVPVTRRVAKRRAARRR
jgi:hypothetical protein